MKDFYKENRPLFYTLIVILLLFCISFIVFTVKVTCLSSRLTREFGEMQLIGV